MLNGIGLTKVPILRKHISMIETTFSINISEWQFRIGCCKPWPKSFDIWLYLGPFSWNVYIDFS